MIEATRQQADTGGGFRCPSRQNDCWAHTTKAGAAQMCMHNDVGHRPEVPFEANNKCSVMPGLCAGCSPANYPGSSPEHFRASHRSEDRRGFGMSEAVEVVKEILRGARLLLRRVALM